MRIPGLAPIFVLLGLVGSASAARAQQVEPPATWQESVPNDPASETNRQFTLTGKFLVPPEGKPATTPTLIVKCSPSRRSAGKGKFQTGAVVVGVPLEIHFVEPSEIRGGISYYPEVSVTYRLDEGKPVNEDWPPRLDKSSVEFQKSDLRKLLRAKSILMTITEKDGHQISMQFDVPPTPARLGEACDVSDLKR